MSSVVKQTAKIRTAVTVSVASGSSPTKASVKRSRSVEVESTTVERPAKTAKTTHPFFQPKDHDTFKWLTPIGKTCQHGVHLAPKASPKVAAFDLDGTLIAPKSGARFPKDHEDWKWWAEGKVVPAKLKSLHDDGYAIVIISNQMIMPTIKDPAKRKAYADKFLKKIPLIAANLPDVPFRIFAANDKDQYRKPIPGSWFELESMYRAEGVEIDRSESFYVGDAAGRAKGKGRSADHNTSDRLFAENAGIKFYTPEEFFLGHEPAPYKLKKDDFHPLSLDLDATASSDDDTYLPSDPTSKPEIVLFIGFPAVGKSTFYRHHFASAGYAHINQDTLKTKDKCVTAVEEAVRSGKSCVVDNTNRDLATRKDYHKVAKKLKVPIRAIYFDVPLKLAWHNNLYRSMFLSEARKSSEPARERVPWTAFGQYQNAFQPPTLDEGFAEVKTVRWKFEGSEEDRRRYYMYLDVFS